jgi:hypothetical protein
MPIAPSPMMPGAAPQGSPQLGSSPATGPTPNVGDHVRGNALIGAALNAMAMAVPLVGAQSEIGQELLSAMQRIGKKMPPGATSPGGEGNALDALRARQQQTGPMMAALQQRAAAQTAGQMPGRPPIPAA